MSERDFMIDDPEHATDMRLEHAIDWRREQIKELEESIQRAEQFINQYQTILDQRAIDRYFDAHPDLTRLNAGDEILITPEYVEWYESTTKQYSRYHAGEVCHISGVFAVDGEPGIVRTKEFGGLTSYDLALRLRQAYLAQQGETT